MVGLIVVMGLLYLPALRFSRFGTFHDDSIYVTTAKSLATGQGYRIISLPYEPAQTKYPPFYPILLSMIWRAYPKFPTNLIAMMLLSTVVTIVLLVTTWRYLTDHLYSAVPLANIVIVLTALNWRTLILATSIFSEMLFAFLSVAALYLAEKYEKERAHPPLALLLGILMGLTFLTRSSGIALMIAVGSYFFVRRRWRQALLPLGVASLFVIGWVVWSYANRTTFSTGNATYYTSYVKDFASILNDVGDHSISAKLGAIANIVVENLIGAIVVSIPVVCTGLNYGSVASLSGLSLGLTVGTILLFFLVIAAGFVRHSLRGFRLLHYFVISYLALHLFWPYASYDRFLMCVLPFLLLFFITEFELPISLIKRKASSQISGKMSAGFIAIMLFLCAGVLLFSYIYGISQTLSSLNEADKHSAEDYRLIDWINQYTNGDDILICYRDPKYYLYTGRKAISFSWPKKGSSWEGQQDLIRRIVNETKGRYLILTSTDFNHDYDEQLQRESLRSLVNQSPDIFTKVFSTEPDGIIYRIDTHD